MAKAIPRKVPTPKKVRAKRVPKAPPDQFIVVRANSKQGYTPLQSLKEADITIRDAAIGDQADYIMYKAIPFRRYSVPSNIVIEEL